MMGGSRGATYHTRLPVKLGVTEQGRSGVMENMQERFGVPSDEKNASIRAQTRTQRLLLQRQKDGVDELEVLEVVVDEVEELQPLSEDDR